MGEGKVVSVRAKTAGDVPQAVRERVVAAARAALAAGREPRLADLRAVGLASGVDLAARAVASLVLEARVLEAERRLRTALGRRPSLREVTAAAEADKGVVMRILAAHGLLRTREEACADLRVERQARREHRKREAFLRERPDIPMPPEPFRASRPARRRTVV